MVTILQDTDIKHYFRKPEYMLTFLSFALYDNLALCVDYILIVIDRHSVHILG